MTPAQLDEFRTFLKDDTPWPGIMAYRKTVGLTAKEWRQFIPTEIPAPTRYPVAPLTPISERTFSKMLAFHSANIQSRR